MMDTLATIATYVLYATAGFLFLPAGRDIVSHKTAILPVRNAPRARALARPPRLPSQARSLRAIGA